MKTMIISDIHGYSTNLKKVIDIYNKTNCQRLIILGDLLTPGYEEDEVKKILNNMSSRILCMRGNNDNYIYLDEFDFNIINDYINIKIDSHNVYLTHGHRFNISNCPFLDNGDILLYGHSHRGSLVKLNNKYFLNPGSISLPRDSSNGSYIIYEDNSFYLYDIDNGLINSINID